MREEEETQFQMIRHWVNFRWAEWQIWLISIQHVFPSPFSMLSYTVEAENLRIIFLRISFSQSDVLRWDLEGRSETKAIVLLLWLVLLASNVMKMWYVLQQWSSDVSSFANIKKWLHQSVATAVSWEVSRSPDQSCHLFLNLVIRRDLQEVHPPWLRQR